MNRKRKWLVDLWQRTGNPYRCPRRIVSPERLESRNAPGVMLPLFGATFDGVGNLDVESETTFARERAETQGFRSSYYSAAVAPSPAMSMAVAPFVEEQLSSEFTAAVPLQPAESQIRVPDEIAALDAAFESFSSGLNRGLSELSQRLIQPVIMDPASPHNQEEPAHIAVDLGPRIIQPVIMDPESEHNVPNSAPLVHGEIERG